MRQIIHMSAPMSVDALLKICNNRRLYVLYHHR